MKTVDKYLSSINDYSFSILKDITQKTSGKMVLLPKIEDPRGNLSFIEHGAKGVCPFEIEKVDWIYDVPAGAVRQRTLSAGSELIVAMSGSFDAVVESEEGKKKVHLNRADRGLAVEPHSRLTFDNFSTNSVAMVLGSGQKSGFRHTEAISHAKSDVDLARIINMPRIRQGNGSVTEVNNADPGMPFDVRRVFYLFDVPADAERGGHSHFLAQELIVALAGSFDVVLDDGKHAPHRFTLNRPYHALYVPTGLWRTLDNFSGGAVCMVLTSERYSEADYVREYEDFKRLTNEAI